MAEDPSVAAVALAVDLVGELDGDLSYPQAVLDAASQTSKPLVVLASLAAPSIRTSPPNCASMEYRCWRDCAPAWSR